MSGTAVLHRWTETPRLVILSAAVHDHGRLNTDNSDVILQRIQLHFYFLFYAMQFFWHTVVKTEL